MPNRLEENTQNDKSSTVASIAEKEARCALVDEGFGRPPAVAPGKVSEKFNHPGSEIKAGGPHKLEEPLIHGKDIKALGPYKTDESIVKDLKYAGQDLKKEPIIKVPNIKAGGPYMTKEPLIAGGGGRCETTEQKAQSENPDVIFNPDGSYKEPKDDNGEVKVTPGGMYELPTLIFPKQTDDISKNRAASQLPFELPNCKITEGSNTISRTDVKTPAAYPNRADHMQGNRAQNRTFPQPKPILVKPGAKLAQ